MDGEGDARAPEGSVAAEALPAQEPASDAGAEGSAESSAPEAAVATSPAAPAEPSSAPPADPSPTPAPADPTAAQDTTPREPLPTRALRWLRDYFLGEDPQFLAALVPFCFLSMFLFTRHPFRTNFIFDEQEALLANPYVRSVADAHPKFGWFDAFHRDFWGLGPERSIGSYRPIPNLVWRFLWMCGAREHNPFLHHWVNVLFHGANGALLTIIVWRVTKRKGVSWLAGMFLVASAVLTEAVSGVVGISDVFGTFGCLLALLALTTRLPAMGPLVFLATLFGLYSKESALVCVPMVPLFALATARDLFPEKPRRVARVLVAFVAAAAAFVFYVETRRRLFPAAVPPAFTAAANEGRSASHRAFAALMRWYGQPVLPRDLLNNPLAATDAPHRIAGALRVYWRGLGQVVFPKTLSGDYSSPQEPVPATLVFPESVLGALCMILPLPVAAALALRSYRAGKAKPAEATKPAADSPYREPAEPAPAVVAGSLEVAPDQVDYRPLVAVSLVWVIASYFPVSNIPIVLPTVRAERFWYFPVVGTSILLAIAAVRAFERARALDVAPPAGGAWETVRQKTGLRRAHAVGLFVAAFTLFQSVAARLHANDYTTDLTFWDATRKAVPRSAKAHLNYSVMKGARGDLESRRAANVIALELAPEWPMASIYLGDTLCRLHRAPEAVPHYKRGFELAPNDINLIALALQCLWDEKMLVADAPLRSELDELGNKNPGSWLDYLVKDILAHGEEHNGVDPKHRPRGYNEGPKE
jgi:tetratricopeptide (TPR) repeat protein